jgi:DNA-binding transcriptional MocR family regulator
VRLADSVRAAIEAGDVPPGAKIPAERSLARLLAVSRTTVVTAYEKLRNEGWLESRQGSGTRARRPGSASPELAAEGGAAAAHRIYRVLAEPQTGMVEFLAAHLPGAGGLAPVLSRAASESAQDWAREPGYFPLGLPELRRVVAKYLTAAGLPSTEEQVLITSGAQQAIALASSLLVKRGDAVVLEDPTYLGAVDVFQSLGAKLLPVSIGRDGLDFALLSEAMRRAAPRLVYLMPTYQNPTGTVLTERQRRQVARLSEQLQVPVLEDNTLAELSLSGDPPPPIGAFSSKAPILTVGSLSKLFWGGLRVGWIRAAEPIVARLAPVKTMSDLGSSVLSQTAALTLLRDVERIRAMRRRECAERMEELASELKRKLPSWTWDPPAGGLSLWVRLPYGTAPEFARIASRHGVSVLPGNFASPEGRFADRLRIPFVLETATMKEGIARLTRAWEAYAPASRAGRRRVGVLV